MVLLAHGINRSTDLKWSHRGQFFTRKMLQNDGFEEKGKKRTNICMSEKEPHPRSLPLQLSALPWLLAVTLPSPAHKGRKEKKQASREMRKEPVFFLFFLRLQQVLKHDGPSEGMNVWLRGCGKLLSIFFFSRNALGWHPSCLAGMWRRWKITDWSHCALNKLFPEGS